MIQTNSLESQAGSEQTGTSIEPEIAPRKGPTSWEYFLRVAVVVIGVVLGGFIALFVGFASGWIPFRC